MSRQPSIQLDKPSSDVHLYIHPSHIQNIMIFCAPNLKAEYLTECLLEVVNNQWKVNAIESGRSFYHKLTYKVGKKYIKVMDSNVYPDEIQSNGVFMFVDMRLVHATNLHPTKHLLRVFVSISNHLQITLKLLILTVLSCISDERHFFSDYYVN